MHGQKEPCEAQMQKENLTSITRKNCGKNDDHFIKKSIWRKNVYVTHQFYRREEISHFSECDHKIGYKIERKDKKEMYFIFVRKEYLKYYTTKLLIKRNKTSWTIKINSYEQRKDNEHIIHGWVSTLYL